MYQFILFVFAVFAYCVSIGKYIFGNVYNKYFNDLKSFKTMFKIQDSCINTKLLTYIQLKIVGHF